MYDKSQPLIINKSLVYDKKQNDYIDDDLVNKNKYKMVEYNIYNLFCYTQNINGYYLILQKNKLLKELVSDNEYKKDNITPNYKPLISGLFNNDKSNYNITNLIIKEKKKSNNLINVKCRNIMIDRKQKATKIKYFWLRKHNKLIRFCINKIKIKRKNDLQNKFKNFIKSYKNLIIKSNLIINKCINKYYYKSRNQDKYKNIKLILNYYVKRKFKKHNIIVEPNNIYTNFMDNSLSVNFTLIDNTTINHNLIKLLNNDYDNVYMNDVNVNIINQGYKIKTHLAFMLYNKMNIDKSKFRYDKYYLYNQELDEFILNELDWITNDFNNELKKYNYYTFEELQKRPTFENITGLDVMKDYSKNIKFNRNLFVNIINILFGVIGLKHYYSRKNSDTRNINSLGFLAVNYQKGINVNDFGSNNSKINSIKTNNLTNSRFNKQLIKVDLSDIIKAKNNNKNKRDKNLIIKNDKYNITLKYRLCRGGNFDDGDIMLYYNNELLNKYKNNNNIYFTNYKHNSFNLDDIKYCSYGNNEKETKYNNYAKSMFKTKEKLEEKQYSRIHRKEINNWYKNYIVDLFDGVNYTHLFKKNGNSYKEEFIAKQSVSKKHFVFENLIKILNNNMYNNEFYDKQININKQYNLTDKTNMEICVY